VPCEYESWSACLWAFLDSSSTNTAAAEPITELGIYVHAFFLVLALGLPFLVLTLEALGIRKKDHDYTHGAKIISQVWAVSFAFGAITGTFVEFGLYLIWPGTILAISSFWFIPFIFDLSAFLIEISFLMAYLHLWEKINTWLHWLLGWGILIGSNLCSRDIGCKCVDASSLGNWLTREQNFAMSSRPWTERRKPNLIPATV